MYGLFKSRMPGQANFRASIKLLETSHLTLLRQEKVRLLTYLTKHYYKKILTTIKEGCRFLYLLDKPPSNDLMLGFSEQFHLLQRELCHYHITKSADKQWYDLGVSLHQILDTYYHIFQKFISNNSCLWCGFDLNSSWSVVITNALLDKQMATYLGMSYHPDDLIGVAAATWGYLLDSNKPKNASTAMPAINLV